MRWLEWIRWGHIGLGVLVFAILPVPLVAKKGGRVHVVGGRIYAWALTVMAVTGVPLAARGLSSPLATRRALAWFLFFIALLAVESAWMGVRALRASRNPEFLPGLLERAPPAVLMVCASALLVLGVARGVVLPIFFGVLGMLLALGQWSFWRRARRERADIIVAHIGAMGVSSIVTVTAFLVTNARYVFGLRAFTVAVWITPAVVGAVAIARAQRRWRQAGVPESPKPLRLRVELAREGRPGRVQPRVVDEARETGQQVGADDALDA